MNHTDGHAVFAGNMPGTIFAKPHGWEALHAELGKIRQVMAPAEDEPQPAAPG